MIGCKIMFVLVLLALVTNVLGQFPSPYGSRGLSQGNINARQQTGGVPVLDDSNHANAGPVHSFRDVNPAPANIIDNGDIFSGDLNALPGRDFQDIFGDDGGRRGGIFPGTKFSSNFLGGQPGNTFGAGLAGAIPQPGIAQAQFADSGFGGNFLSGSPFQFSGDSNSASNSANAPAFQPLFPSFAVSSKVVALPDVTLTRTLTEDRFFTTTDVVFVKEARTASFFSFVTQTAITTVVVPTPADRIVVVSTALVTGAPLTITVTEIRSNFQYLTRTEVQYVTLTHTSHRFTHETLINTVTRVQTVPSTLVRTQVNTVTTTFTDTRFIISTVFTGYH